jgi:hypothetical protein
MIALFLGGVVISTGAAIVELRGISMKPPTSGSAGCERSSRLTPASRRSLRYLRNWLVLDGAVVYGLGLVGFDWKCLSCAASEWPGVSLALDTGIFLFSLALVPALLAWFDGYRGRDPKTGRLVGVLARDVHDGTPEG